VTVINYRQLSSREEAWVSKKVVARTIAAMKTSTETAKEDN